MTELPIQLNGSHNISEVMTKMRLDTTIDFLLTELPMVEDGQIRLAELLSRVVQAVYAELTEFAETMPQMSDAARKRTLAEFCIRIKKQVAKLYAVMRWAREANVVQQCMNIVAFVMNQNNQIEEAIESLQWIKASLIPSRLRNHDLLTALDVLTIGSYCRLPSTIAKQVIPFNPPDRVEVEDTIRRIENLIHFRLKAFEPLPTSMSRYRFSRGLVIFSVPNKFEASISLEGTLPQDGWLFVGVEFLFNSAAELLNQDFPRRPSGVLKQFIVNEANVQLTYYSGRPTSRNDDPSLQDGAISDRPQLRGAIDAPLVRLFNFLQTMSLSYQLEILCFQAQRLRGLGWADYLKVDVSRDRRSFQVSYWQRKLTRLQPNHPGSSLPLFGGTITVSLILGGASACDTSSPIQNTLAALDKQRKMEASGDERKWSDTEETMSIQATWTPAEGFFGIHIKPGYMVVDEVDLMVHPQSLNFEQLLLGVVRKHSHGVLQSFRDILLQHVFPDSNNVFVRTKGNDASLEILLTAEEVISVNIDSRTGRLNLKDSGDFASASRGSRFFAIRDKVNEYPGSMPEFISRFRYVTILDSAEQKALYLGLKCFRQRNLKARELAKFGPTSRAHLFIQLTSFPSHYLVIVVTDVGFKYALIALRQVDEGPRSSSIMDDIGWLDAMRISNEGTANGPLGQILFLPENHQTKNKDITLNPMLSRMFHLDSRLLRELYMYCCARVAHLGVEQQLKENGYGYSHVAVSRTMAHSNAIPSNIQATVSHAIPALCVKSKDILAGAEAEDAVENNVRIMPIHWWSSGQTKVLTCLKLKHVQSTMSKAVKNTKRIIRPSKSIAYDTRAGIISVLSPTIHGCIIKFLADWSTVSKMVVITREVSQMSETVFPDIILLSFDLQTVEFMYSKGYGLAISCRNEDNTSPVSSLRFFCVQEQLETGMDNSIASTPSFHGSEPTINPHNKILPWSQRLLSRPNLASNIRNLIGLLRISLPVLLEFDHCLDELEKKCTPSWIAKSISWWRFVLIDGLYAIDFRIRSDLLLEFVDAGYSQKSLEVSRKRQPRRVGFEAVPGMNLLCKRIALGYPQLHVVPLENGILLPQPKDAQRIRDVVSAFIRATAEEIVSV